MSDLQLSPEAAIESERDATDRLMLAHGPLELQAALLALLLPPGSQRAVRAWQIETAATPGAENLRKHVASLSGAARLPWFELMLRRMAAQPIAARQELFRATRRVMGARGVARPIDRLHWLWMRRALGEAAPLAARPEASGDVAQWLESDVLAIAAYTAFLSRMVPAEGHDGTAWYDSAMEAWQPFAAIPACDPPPAEAMAEALKQMQTLSWMKRPLVVRYWLTAITVRNRGVRLDDGAADALRLSCALLDSPQPPDLARHYITLPVEADKLA